MTKIEKKNLRKRLSARSCPFSASSRARRKARPCVTLRKENNIKSAHRRLDLLVQRKARLACQPYPEPFLQRIQERRLSPDRANIRSWPWSESVTQSEKRPAQKRNISLRSFSWNPPETSLQDDELVHEKQQVYSRTK